MPRRPLTRTCLLVLLCALPCAAEVGSARGEAPAGISASEFAQLQDAVQALRKKIAVLVDSGNFKQCPQRDYLADAELFAKVVEAAFRYDQKFEPTDVELLRKALALGTQRADELDAGKHAWTGQKGFSARGFVSEVDGSTQGFGLIVPANFDPDRPTRLDVVLHGSTRTAAAGMSELRFLARFIGDDLPPPPEQNYLELRPLGRVEHCYRWASETDIFEAIEAVCRRYQVDRDRIVLRGQSMGASGTWHLGLKHPDFFVALGPYCGYVDTHRFSQTNMPNFIQVGPLPAIQEQGLHMLDSVDYAANAGVVPVVACMGAKDPFFDAHVIMGEAMKREGLQLVNLISPNTGHEIDPVTFAEQMRQIGGFADKGLDRASRRLRFVTWTLKYHRCHWLELLGLGEHYARAELSAEIADGGSILVREPVNVTRFAIHPPAAQPAVRVTIAGREVVAATPPAGGKPATIYFTRTDQGWQAVAADNPTLRQGKRPGLQGPIDDAFTTSFLCVRGTGTPWNPAVQAWSEANLKRFAYEWNRYLRGDLRIKNDSDVTPSDLAESNLILFGDPGSNLYIERVLRHLPIQWTKDALQVAGQKYSASDHAPALVYPNPLPGAENRYLVLNSGHTFHEREYAALNYLLFPRMGDWGVLKVGGRMPAIPSDPLDESVVRADYFDENWLFKPAAAASQSKP